VLKYDLDDPELRSYVEKLRRFADSQVARLPTDPGPGAENRVHPYSDDDVTIEWVWDKDRSTYELYSMDLREESHLFADAADSYAAMSLTAINLWVGIRRGSDDNRQPNPDVCDSGDLEFEIAAWNSHAEKPPAVQGLDAARARGARILLKLEFTN